MKKKIQLSVVMVCLLAMLLPMSVSAAVESSVKVGNTALVVGTYYKTNENGAIVAEGNENDYNIYLSFDGIKYSLTLNNATIKGMDNTNQGAGIYYNGYSDGVPLLIILEGKNTVTAGTYSSGWSTAVYVEEQSLTVSGNGELDARSDTYNTSVNYGSGSIYVSNGGLLIEGGIITAIAGDADTYSHAIYASEVTITGGTVYANCMLADGNIVPVGGGENTDVADGIFCAGSGKITIAGGTVNVTGGTAANSSCGIRGQVIDISNGVVNVIGGTASYGSCGINASEALNISGGTVNAEGGTAASSCGIYSNSSSASISISGGTVTATGGNGAIVSCGIGSVDEISIGGNAIVTATGGASATGDSYGIGATNKSVTISDSATIDATGGIASTGNSYGIGAVGNVIVNGSDANVTAAGGEAEESYGIGASLNFVLNGSNANIFATGGNADRNSYGIGATVNMQITDGTVNAVGGKATNGNSYGIGTEGTLTVTGGIITATSGEATNGNSYGVGAVGNIEIQNGKITASGNSKAIASGSGNITIKGNVNDGSYLVFGGNLDGTEELLEDWSNLQNYRYVKAGLKRIVTFDGNGGSGEMNEMNVISGDAIELPDNEFGVPEAKQFKAWAIDSVDGEQYAAGSEYIVNADTALYAIWSNIYTVGVSTTEGGTVTGTGTYVEGTSVTVTATANDGYRFVKWMENDVEVSTEASYSFTATANRNLVAVFEENEENQSTTTYAIGVSASPVEGGTVAGNGTYGEGASVTVAATANDGYRFVKWMENDVEVSTEASYRFVVVANRNLVAVFEEEQAASVSDRFTVTMSDGGTGASGVGEYTEGTEVAIYAGTRANYRFNGWISSEGVTFGDANSESTTFVMPGRNVSVTATWVSIGGNESEGSSTNTNTNTVEAADTTDTDGVIPVSPKTGEPDTAQSCSWLMVVTVIGMGIGACILWRKKKVM